MISSFPGALSALHLAECILPNPNKLLTNAVALIYMYSLVNLSLASCSCQDSLIIFLFIEPSAVNVS